MGSAAGGTPAPAESFRAVGPGDLAPFREVLADQEFRLADLVRDPVKGAVTLVVRRRFPPRRGVWALRILSVKEWTVDRRGEKATDTLKEIHLDPRTGRVVIRCVLDEYVASVGRVDLRLARLDADEAAAVSFEKLPDWFHHELREKQNAADAEEMRIVEVRHGLRRLAAIGGTVPPLLIGLFTGGIWWLLLILCPLMAGGTAWWLAGTPRSPQTAGPIYGLAATAACFGSGGIGGFFFTPLLLIALGVALFIWIRGEEDLRV